MFNSNLLLLIFALTVSLPSIDSLSVASGNTGSLHGRIFKGDYDLENEYRYHVAILRLTPNDTTEHMCGGAIIDTHYLLTAAHCVYGQEKKSLIIRSGWNKAPDRPELEKRVYHRVARIMYLKDYFHTDCRNHEHDIAIVKVQRSFDLADDVNFQKVNLPEYNNDYEEYPVILTGYGIEKVTIRVNKTTATREKLFKYPQELKYLETKVISLEKCKRIASVILTNGNLCTSQQNSHGFSCVGDSGGPLVHDGVVIGIRNSHNSQCLQEQPETFTRVSSYLSFINNILNREASADVHYI